MGKCCMRENVYDIIQNKKIDIKKEYYSIYNYKGETDYE